MATKAKGKQDKDLKTDSPVKKTAIKPEKAEDVESRAEDESALDIITPPPASVPALTDDEIIERGEVASLFADERMEPYLFGTLQGLIDEQKHIILRPSSGMEDIIKSKHAIEAYTRLEQVIRGDASLGKHKAERLAGARG